MRIGPVIATDFHKFETDKLGKREEQAILE